MEGLAPRQGAALLRHPLAAAVCEVVAEKGYAESGIGDFARRAGVERAEFDRLFADKADAVLRVFEAYREDFEATVGRAFASEPSWPASLRAAGYATARWFRANPGTMGFGMVGVLGAGEMVRVRREEVFLWCAGLIDAGREVAPDPDAVPQGAPLIALGAVTEMVTRLAQGTLEADLIETVPKMMYGAVRPYLGEAAARRELEIPPPPDLTGPSPCGPRHRR
jgi:AcrR family transcriptional regulator